MSTLPARPVEAQAFQGRPQPSPPTQPFATWPTPGEHFHTNTACVEGLIAKVWTYNGDVYARLAIYDRHAEVLPSAAPEPSPLPRRKAHYISLCLLRGQTIDGMAVSLQAKERVKVTGYLRDRSYSESLERLFKKLEHPARIQPGDDAIFVGRSATYLVVETLIRLS